MDDETIIELDQSEAPQTEPISDEHDVNASGRCRIYNSSKEKIGCKNTTDEDACAAWARYKGAYGYGWAPGSSC
ncbi:MAG: hypothetical protein DHS20C02_14270 [Micavibrio sp.]|nr:MAG: hypothetical protein DHS20C02_14270 [Micavibrio sp.]